MIIKLHEMRELIKSYYARFSIYINPALKGISAFILYTIINTWLNFSKPLSNPFIILLLSLFSAIFPWKFISFAAILIILIHLKAVSIYYVILVGFVLILMYLVYFHFSVERGILLVITPILFALKIPYVLPVAVGLLGNPSDSLGMILGIIFFYLLAFAKGHIIPADTGVAKHEIEQVTDSLLEAGEYLFKNPTIVLYIIVFSAVLSTVYMIKRIYIKHAWFIAVSAGTIIMTVALLLGDYKLEVPINIGELFLGIICSIVINMIITFFAFNVEYLATENYQFEDDEYYYYVKAVPKISMPVKNRTVRRITTKSGGNYQTDDIEWGRGTVNKK